MTSYSFTAVRQGRDAAALAVVEEFRRIARDRPDIAEQAAKASGLVLQYVSLLEGADDGHRQVVVAVSGSALLLDGRRSQMSLSVNAYVRTEPGHARREQGRGLGRAA